MRNIIYILIVILVMPVILLSTDINFNGKSLFIKTETIGKNEYVNPDVLVNTFKLFIENHDNELYLEKGLIRYSAGSFFLVYENEKELLVYQLPSPVISFKNSEYIPVNGFFLALNHFKIFNVNIENHNIFIHSIEEPESKKSNKIISHSLDLKEEVIKSNSKINIPENNKEKNYKTDFSSTFYELSLEIVRNIQFNELPDTNRFKRLDYPPDIYLLPESLKKK